MAKLFKITTYIVDSMDEFDADSMEDCLIYCTQNDLSLRHIKIQSADIGEWDDDVYCPESEFEKYFKEN